MKLLRQQCSLPHKQIKFVTYFCTLLIILQRVYHCIILIPEICVTRVEFFFFFLLVIRYARRQMLKQIGWFRKEISINRYCTRPADNTDTATKVKPTPHTYVAALKKIIYPYQVDNCLEVEPYILYQLSFTVPVHRNPITLMCNC